MLKHTYRLSLKKVFEQCNIMVKWPYKLSYKKVFEQCHGKMDLLIVLIFC